MYGFCIPCDSAEMLINNSCVVISKYEQVTCALFTNISKVKCWGQCGWSGCGIGSLNNIGDNVGEMGHGLPFVDLGDFPVASVSVGGQGFVCVLSKAGRVKCWGSHLLGSSNSNQENMGSNLPEINLGTDVPVIELSVGADHVCVLFKDNSVKCWGRSDMGQLGYGSWLAWLEDSLT